MIHDVVIVNIERYLHLCQICVCSIGNIINICITIFNIKVNTLM